MSSAAVPRRRTNPVVVLIRVIVVTVAFGILGGGVGALMGIIGVAIINAAGVPTDMSMALFTGAVPGGLIGAVIGFVVIVRSERRAMQNRISAEPQR